MASNGSVTFSPDRTRSGAPERAWYLHTILDAQISPTILFSHIELPSHVDTAATDLAPNENQPHST